MIEWGALGYEGDGIKGAGKLKRLTNETFKFDPQIKEFKRKVSF
ncbi:hypothetical protein J2S13_001438 [Oikeobacillus pervagus]|uniref:Uncharacterized protein n=1 Tax=Oikeobacillus pervagus TaxID=1325931 RepID=A0AAJ1SYT0_9BACI|nr:hypothetical protein [Oikeobacillus pervagus]MDQ0215039.1 hypothetical protein [Oikeobacillus pervagus]